MKEYEIFFYGSVFVEDDEEESAVSKATEFLNENPNDFIEVREVEEI
jgi:hypothetical protein